MTNPMLTQLTLRLVGLGYTDMLILQYYTTVDNSSWDDRETSNSIETASSGIVFNIPLFIGCESCNLSKKPKREKVFSAVIEVERVEA
jgi:hypothetical protein